jgi:alkaline phosphatase D
VTRRHFLLASTTTAALAAAPTLIVSAAVAANPRRLADDPFQVGIASGDPDHQGVVLWTRLAVDPLAPDGFGGMPSRSVPVNWQIARDPAMADVVRAGAVEARPSSAHAVHVEVNGLEPGREYFYRFRVGPHVSETGRTRTAPAPGTSGGPLTMCYSSCANYSAGYFTAYRHLAEEQPDLILQLGDYLYEGPGGANAPRAHSPGEEIRTLADYRVRHAQYKTDADLQAAHAIAPWVVVWDDHELENNYADEIPSPPNQPGFLARRAAAYQAYYENMPLRQSSVPSGIDMQLYRRVQWGELATLHMLDTRQYRDDQACGDGRKDCAEASDPSRSICGATQEQWLLDGLAASTATWDLLGQQVFFAARDFTSGPKVAYSMDAWDGYVASRDRITNGAVERGVDNLVVLTGDVHRHYADELKADYHDPDSATVGTELVTTSITSDGDGQDVPADSKVQRTENPHIKFINGQRGYVRATITPDQLTADFRVLPFVTEPGAPVSTRATFAVEAGNPGLHPV